jgi:hypothetical protein
MDGAGQVNHKHHTPLEHAHQQQVIHIGIVTADMLSQALHPGLDIVVGNQDSINIVMHSNTKRVNRPETAGSSASHLVYS